ncbi:NAD(P)H-dependent oxidoreductase subunit E, partial [Akkermansiaceae bacterium]|nr:NAD(P)H-dependent oxidoreductase subunit E [Akkermansiaceae bacterium]
MSSDIEVPKASDRAEVSNLSGYPPVAIDIPLPQAIDRDLLVYSAGLPKPRIIDRNAVEYLPPVLSVLEKNIHSAKTPGEKFFPKFAITEALEKKADERIAQYPDDHKRSAVLPLLHEVQHRFGYISPESIDWVAGKLEIEPIKVVEVVTFYPGFRQKAPGKLHLRVCRTLSCAMGGSYELMDKLCEITGIDRAAS